MSVSRSRPKKKHRHKVLAPPLSQATKRANALFTGLLVVGLVMSIFVKELYEATIMPCYVPVGIWIGAGISSYLSVRRYMAKHNVGHIMLTRSFACFMGFGSIVVFGFMAINYYAPGNSPTETMDVDITGAGHKLQGRSRCASPYVLASVRGYEKQFICDCDTRSEEYDGVRVELRKGFFGYDRIMEWWLLRK